MISGDALRRLAGAVLAAALLQAVFAVAADVGRITTITAMMKFGTHLAIAAAIYAPAIPGLYFASRAAERIGLAGGVVFPMLFVALAAVWSYLAAGGKILDAGTVAIALIADLILFGWPSTWLDDAAD